MQLVKILTGRDKDKIAKLTKVLPDGNISVRFMNGVKIIVDKGNYTLVK